MSRRWHSMAWRRANLCLDVSKTRFKKSLSDSYSNMWKFPAKKRSERPEELETQISVLMSDFFCVFRGGSSLSIGARPPTSHSDPLSRGAGVLTIGAKLLSEAELPSGWFRTGLFSPPRSLYRRFVFGSVIRSDGDDSSSESWTNSLVVHFEGVDRMEVSDVCTELQESVSEVFPGRLGLLLWLLPDEGEVFGSGSAPWVVEEAQGRSLSRYSAEISRMSCDLTPVLFGTVGVWEVGRDVISMMRQKALSRVWWG